MSVLRPLLSRRGRLVFVATALLLVGALLAAPSVSGAKAAVKQFTATITPGTATGGLAGTWTEQVTNCGFPVVSPCTASSTIGLGTIRIAVPTEFRPVTVSISAPPGRNWTASYDSATGNINAGAVTGSDKLQPGESVSIMINATPAACAPGTSTFTAAAWGSASVPGTDPFAIQPPGSQPTVTLAANEACVASGGTVSGPNGQTETVTGDFQGHVLVTFGGDLDCSFDPTFGAQWSQFHLPTQVNITPGADFMAGSSAKISTSRFPAGAADSSSYLICYAFPTAGHTAFATRGGGTATVRTIGGTDFYVGILPNCYDPVTGLTRPEPCVSEQFLDLATNEIVISVRSLPGDPFKR
jgi:hypothetical protein